MNVWRFKSCSKCGGDLFFEDDEWGCIQCGRYYYPKADLPLAYPQLIAVASGGGNDNRGKRRRTGGIAGRNINAVVGSQLASTRRWRERNQQVIASLDAGRTVSETAGVLGRFRRQVRSVAERLQEIKVLTPERTR